MERDATNTAIDAELLSLERERDQTLADHELAKQQVTKTHDRLTVLDAQIEILRKVRGAKADTNGAVFQLPALPSTAISPRRVLISRFVGDPVEMDKYVGMSPTEAILKLLEQHPEGLTERDVVDALENKVHTTSKNVRRLLGSMLYQQREKKRVIKVGKLHRLAANQNGAKGG